MSDIDIIFRVHDGDLDKLRPVIEQIVELGNKTERTGEQAKTAKTGWEILGFSIGTFVGGVAKDLLHQLPEMVEQLYNTGVESLRVKTAFEEMGGSADAIAKMQAATHGLADDTDLMAAGTLALSAGVVKSTADLTELARIGGTLGMTFKGSATEGVTAFTNALDSVGNVRALRQLGVDAVAVKERFDELKKIFGDKEAWKAAVFEVAGTAATKLAGNLDGAGTAVDKLKIRWDDFIEGEGEKFAQWVDDRISDIERLNAAMAGDGAGSSASGAVDAVGTRHGVAIDRQYNEQATNLYRTGQGGAGAYQSLVNTWGQRIADEMMQSQGSRPAMLDQLAQQSGGFQPYYARYIPNYGDMTSGRNQYGMNPKAKINFDLMNEEDTRTSSDITGLRPVAGRSMGDNALRGEFVKPYEADHRQATELATVKSLLGDISGIAGDYNSKMLAVLAPLSEQQRILEKRKSIQSIDDAFGIERDGLYSEIGSGMSGAIATRRDRVSQELRRKIGTGGTTSYASADQIKAYDEKAKAERDAYERSIGDPTAEELYKGGDYKKSRMATYDKQHTSKRKATLRRTKGKVYTKKDYERDMQQFDRDAKEATDAYAIATGAATKESIKMNDQLDQARKNYEDGKISLTQYKNELLLLGEAAKSGTTSMDQLTQIQIRLNYGLKMGVTTKGKTAQSDASLYEEHAGGVKGTKSYAGNGIENATKPFDDIVVSADKASAAAETFGSKAGQAVGDVAKGAVGVADGFLKAVSALQNTSSQVDILKSKIKELESISITITTTSKGGGGTGGRTGRAGGVQGPPR